MSFENFQLPAFLIQDLYKDMLIDKVKPALNPLRLNKGKISFLGRNEKNILLIYSEENTAHTSEGDLGFLLDILGACKLSLSDIALVNINQNIQFNNITVSEQFNPGINILFGVEPSALDVPLHFPHFQIQQYNNQAFLSCPSLRHLAADKQLKQKLWDCLKKLFSL